MIKSLMTLSISCLLISCSSLSPKVQKGKTDDSRLLEVKKLITNRQYKEATEELNAMSIKDPYNLQVMQLKLDVIKLSQQEERTKIKLPGDPKTYWSWEIVKETDKWNKKITIKFSYDHNKAKAIYLKASLERSVENNKIHNLAGYGWDGVVRDMKDHQENWSGAFYLENVRIKGNYLILEFFLKEVTGKRVYKFNDDIYISLKTTSGKIIFDNKNQYIEYKIENSSTNN